MLPRPHRLTAQAEFSEVTRTGRKFVQPPLIVHVSWSPGSGDTAALDPARIGLTVGKAVGNAVVRHHVSRVIRHAVASDAARLPAGSRWVIRAMPEAGTSTRGIALAWRAALERALPTAPVAR